MQLRIRSGNIAYHQTLAQIPILLNPMDTSTPAGVWRKTMTDGTFEKVQHSDNRMYGPPKLLICGFPAPAQPKFMKLF
jgi:hypothetical protein